MRSMVSYNISRPTPWWSRLPRQLGHYSWLALPAGLLLLAGVLALSVLSLVAPAALPPSSPATASAALSLPDPAADPAAAPTTPNTPSPWRLHIPTLNLDAAIQAVGVTKDGNMAVPNNYTDVGWYRAGARPGTPGTAVLAGHLSDRYNQPAVFGSLHKLRTGDKLSITEKAKPTLRFRVTHTQTYDVTTAPLDKIFTSAISTNGTHLNLITCSGTWNQATKDYTQRLVVFTELVE